MYQKMLVPLDGSEFAECALEHVKRLATSFKIENISLIYVVEPLSPAVAEASPEFIDRALQSSLQFGRDYLARTAAKLKIEGLTANTVLAQGRAADVILECAGSNGADLIVMSTHGRSGVTRFLMGSVADRVVHGSTASVFLVPPAGCRI